ncbi:hypothetical protein M011DRAFT_476951 [Sporormia fimetaria CBS 119925]|uniref:Cyclin N-terminal domain-containing protein n=1 Tax=Sporormia fimetaria CBS 119925 TaxID=1340428 RepID=A0A6A6VFB1_9PLEO|nr:hypothetical protein M011DRAFT_476951 [Sporormia fimetaria CBS 119925]
MSTTLPLPGMIQQYGYSSPALSSPVSTPPATQELDMDMDVDDMTDEELDLYFANYVPLSNLPTPPPVKEKEAIVQITEVVEGDDEEEIERDLKEEKLWAQATHLTHLVPQNLSTRQCSIPTIHAYLSRAHLPDEIVAFAACILSSLSPSFSTSFHATCNRASPPSHTYQDQEQEQNQEQEDINPEILPLAALAIAHNYLADPERSTRQWAAISYEGIGGRPLFETREVERVKWCLLRDIDYGLARITAEMVGGMMRDMCAPTIGVAVWVREDMGTSTDMPATSTPTSMATVMTTAAAKDQALNITSAKKSAPRWLVLGNAMWVNGMQTPEPSP